MEALAADGRAVLAEEGYAADEIDFNYRYELRYAGQSSELAVEVPASAAPLVLQQLPAAFGSEYRRTFGYVADAEIGRASCWERVCQYVYLSVLAVSFKKNT